MNLLTILISIFFFHCSNSLSFNSLQELGLDITNDIQNLIGFDSSPLAGQPWNPFNFDIEDIFPRYAIEFKRNYTEEEKAERKLNLLKSIQAIAQIIKGFIRNSKSIPFKVGLNQFADKNNSEYGKLLGYKPKRKQIIVVSDRKKRSASDPICQPKTSSPLPVSYDCRTLNIVTPVKDQLQCGSCWAFSSAAAIESQWAKKTGKLIDLSEQDLVNSASSHGCDGDSAENAFQFVKDNGQAMETSAPYKAKVDPLYKHYPLNGGVQISDYCSRGGTTYYMRKYSNGTTVKWNETDVITDDQIMRSIIDYGPVVVAINATDPSFQFYKSGIFDLPNCSTDTNHAVLLIGWGILNNINYWIVKNSWGTSWGESGYFRIVRGKNMCGINTTSCYPFLTNATPINKTS